MSLFDYSTELIESKLVKNGKRTKFIAVSNLTKEKFLEAYKDVDPARVFRYTPRCQYREIFKKTTSSSAVMR